MRQPCDPVSPASIDIRKRTRMSDNRTQVIPSTAVLRFRAGRVTSVSAAMVWSFALIVVGGRLLNASAGETAVPAANTFTEEKSPDTEVTLRDGTWQDVQTLVQSHKGKVVIVDIWSTSCLPCMEEFPGLVKLHREFGDKVVCVSFNVDYVGIRSKPASTYRPRVEEFLRGQKAAFVNYLSTVESDRIFETLELSSIPAVLVYGADGTLAKQFDGSLLQDGDEEAFTYKRDIHPFVADLLKQK